MVYHDLMAPAIPLHAFEALAPLEVRSPVLLHYSQTEAFFPARGKSMYEEEPCLSEKNRVLLVLPVQDVYATFTPSNAEYTYEASDLRVLEHGNGPPRHPPGAQATPRP